MSHQYKDPAGGNASTIGSQMNTFLYAKKALIEARKEQYFGQLSGTIDMPKHMGKTIKKYHYLPLLDDRNVNDQGIDAAGATIVDGNLYGSSKDVGNIAGKLPMLTENGGRVNRVGFTRVDIEGTIEKMGFFYEYSQESLDFDSDADLEQHLYRESVNGAMEMTEDALQIDLLNGAGVTKFCGGAVSDATVDADVVTYGDLLRLSIDLDNNRTPMQTKIITGTRNVDTKTISKGRVMYVGSEMQPVLDAMKDSHNERAFIPVEKYAAGGNTLNGEIGAVGKFRIVVVPEMMKWEGVGADATGNATHYQTGNKFDVFPMLVAGGGAFTNIGFQSSGKNMKFKIIHKKPGVDTADRNDPYGEMGFASTKWWHGVLIERPERLALLKTSAVM